MKKFGGRNRWQVLVQRAISENHRNNRIVSNDWQGFTKKEVDLLLQINDPNTTIESIKCQNDFLEILGNGSSKFVEQCLFTSMGINRQYFEEKFLPLFQLVEQLVLDGVIMSVGREKLVQSLLLHLVENEDLICLKMLLSATSHEFRKRMNISPAQNTSEQEGILTTNTSVKYPDNNCIILMRACAKNNFELVRILILAGYRSVNPKLSQFSNYHLSTLIKGSKVF